VVSDIAGYRIFRIPLSLFVEGTTLEHDPEKHASDLTEGGTGFPSDKREAFARRSCSDKRMRS